MTHVEQANNNIIYFPVERWQHSAEQHEREANAGILFQDTLNALFLSADYRVEAGGRPILSLQADPTLQRAPIEFTRTEASYQVHMTLDEMTYAVSITRKIPTTIPHDPIVDGFEIVMERTTDGNLQTNIGYSHADHYDEEAAFSQNDNETVTKIKTFLEDFQKSTYYEAGVAPLGDMWLADFPDPLGEDVLLVDAWIKTLPWIHRQEVRIMLERLETEASYS